MTDLDALFRAILDHPDDDTPRLIYADALEDVGESDRAALIRAQVELARVPEYDPLRVRAERHTPGLISGGPFILQLPQLPDGLRWPPKPFRRGFPAAIHAPNGAVFAAHAGDLFGRFPIEELELRVTRSADLRPLKECEWLGRIVRLTVLDGLSGPVARPLFGLPNLGRLTELTIGAPLTTAPATRAVIRSKAFGRLSAFACHTDRGGGPVIAELTHLVDPPHLTKLDVSSNQMTAERVARLAAAPVMSDVEELDLSDNNLGPEGAAAVAAASLPRVRALRMLRTGPRDEGVRALAASGLVEGLRSLYLGGNNLGPSAAQALAKAAAAENLRVLDLTDNRLGDDGAIALAHSPHLRNLILLDLAGNLVEDRGADALAESPHLDGLIYLGLSGSVISPPAEKRLRDRFGGRVFL
jgi:uncharacterized protein (TIGR02996 family)